eukprot:1028767-Pyramimonas_sp.AAC.1
MDEVADNVMAFDTLSGSLKPVPSTVLWATGIECDALSGLNASSRIGQGVVAAGEGKTGTSAEYTL